MVKQSLLSLLGQPQQPANNLQSPSLMEKPEMNLLQQLANKNPNSSPIDNNILPAINDFTNNLNQNLVNRNPGQQPQRLMDRLGSYVEGTDNKIDDTLLGGAKLAGKAINHPIGRGALMAGIVAGTGGGELGALAYGGSVAAGRQNYLNKLQGQNTLLEQLGMEPLNGYVGDNLLSSMLKVPEMQQRQNYYDKQGKYYDARIEDLQNNVEESEEADPNIIPYSQALRTILDLDSTFADRYNEIIKDKYYDPDKVVNFDDILNSHYRFNPKKKTVEYVGSTGKSNPKLEQSQDYKNALSQYAGLTDAGQKAYAKQRFIKLFGIDPDKKLSRGRK